jgi:hypothetical protein
MSNLNALNINALRELQGKKEKEEGVRAKLPLTYSF